MLKLIIKATVIICAALVFVGCNSNSNNVHKIVVPVTVQQGDALDGICIKLADEYGDERNYKEIVYYAQVQNHVQRFIYPGQTLFVELEVPQSKSR